MIRWFSCCCVPATSVPWSGTLVDEVRIVVILFFLLIILFPMMGAELLLQDAQLIMHVEVRPRLEPMKYERPSIAIAGDVIDEVSEHLHEVRVVLGGQLLAVFPVDPPCLFHGENEVDGR